MPTIAKDSPSQNFEQAPVGMQQAVCVFVNDIGMQVRSFAGEDKLQHKIVISWELAEKQSDGEHFIVSKFYTLSLNEKANLRKDLDSWRGKAFTEPEIENGFDVDCLIGVNCFLNITTNEKGKSTVSTVNPLPKNVVKIAQTLNGMPENFSKWIESLRQKAVNPAEHTVTTNEPQSSDDLPF